MLYVYINYYYILSVLISPYKIKLLSKNRSVILVGLGGRDEDEWCIMPKCIVTIIIIIMYCGERQLDRGWDDVSPLC